NTEGTLSPTPGGSMTPLELSYLAGILDTVAGIYSEPRPNGKRRATIDIEVANYDLALRLADLLDATPPRQREQRPRGDIQFRRPTYRVRIRGAKARDVLLEAFPYLTAATRDRVHAALGDAGDLGVLSPLPHRP